MGDPKASVYISPIPSFCSGISFITTYRAIDDAIRRDDEEYLQIYLTELRLRKTIILQRGRMHEDQYYSAVNLSGDPLISVLISYEKTELAMKLLDLVDKESLLEANLQGNTALHVAAAVGDKVMDVADQLITMNMELLNKRNDDKETPLMLAALHGQRNIFWMIYDRGHHNNAIVDVRRKDGSSVLHCAIIGNAPRLALDIAVRFQHLRITRNTAGVTPLQLLMALPGAFKSKMEFGPLESFIYNCIPLHDEDKREREASFAIENVYDPSQLAPENQDDEENQQVQRRKSFPPNYATMFNLFKLTKIPAGLVPLIFNILKQRFPKIEQLEQKKKYLKETMALIDSLSRDVEYWAFIDLGKTGQLDESRSFTNQTSILDKKISHAVLYNWNESPLITAAKMGLHEFVDKILEVYPQSVNILDAEGKNILQTASQLESKKIFELVASKLTSRNPMLPSPLLYARYDKINTILHYAAEVTVDAEVAGALQMQKDLQWFEKVENLMPRELRYSRNAEEMTAQEWFSKKHKTMAKKGKEQLIQLGQTCSSLVAAFVFASSFSIPGSDNSGSDIYGKAAFFVFKNAFVFGLSCAATALVLFLSLITSSYREREFRRSLPTKLFFAVLSFFLTLISLLVAFACNVYLQIYSQRKIGAKELIPFLFELTVIPALTLFVLLYRGCSFGVTSLVHHVWR